MCGCSAGAGAGASTVGVGAVQRLPTPHACTLAPRWLQRLGPEDSQFIYDAAAGNCLDIATHRHGCCVLQRCIDYATNPQVGRVG